MKTRADLHTGLRRFSVAAAFLALGAGTVAAAPPAAPIPTPDHSLSVKEYTDLGLPAIDKAWTPEDYEKAAKVLGDLAKKDSSQLPRLGSAKSGAVFDRIISNDNLPPLADTDVTPMDRLIATSKEFNGVVSTLAIYDQASTGKQSLDVEFLKLSLCLLHAEANRLLLLDEVEKINPEAAKDSKWVKLSDRIKDDAENSISNFVVYLTDHETVRDAEAVRAAGDFKNLLTEMHPYLTPEGQKSLRESLATAIDAETVPDRKTALQSLLSAVTKK